MYSTVPAMHHMTGYSDISVPLTGDHVIIQGHSHLDTVHLYSIVQSYLKINTPLPNFHSEQIQ